MGICDFYLIEFFFNFYKLTIRITCVCNRSILDATVKAVVVVIAEEWFVEVNTGTGSGTEVCLWCLWRCCCSTSARGTTTVRWLPLLLSLSPLGECSCPVIIKKFSINKLPNFKFKIKFQGKRRIFVLYKPRPISIITKRDIILYFQNYF